MSTTALASILAPPGCALDTRQSHLLNHRHRNWEKDGLHIICSWYDQSRSSQGNISAISNDSQLYPLPNLALLSSVCVCGDIFPRKSTKSFLFKPSHLEHGRCLHVIHSWVRYISTTAQVYEPRFYGFSEKLFRHTIYWTIFSESSDRGLVFLRGISKLFYLLEKIINPIFFFQ